MQLLDAEDYGVKQQSQAVWVASVARPAAGGGVSRFTVA